MRRAGDLNAVLDGIAERRARYREERTALYGWAPDVNCPTCGDTGTVPDKKHTVCSCSAGDVVQSERRRLAAWESAMPLSLRSWDFDGAPDVAAAAKVQHWWLAADPVHTGQNLILYGPPGTGKTGLAVAASKVLCWDDARVAFFVAADWLDDLRAPRPDRGPGPAEAAMREAMRATVLVLDDLGAERVTDFVTEKTYMLINHRMNAGKPTIVTTNLEPVKLRAAFGDRIMRRLLQDGRALELTLLGA